MFTLRSPDSTYCFRVQRSAEVVNAMIYNLHPRQVATISHAEAQKGLDAEFAFWTYQFTDAK